MATGLRLDDHTLGILCCPVCKSRLRVVGTTEFQCVNGGCLSVFPIVDGVPILINEATSVFTFQDFVQKRETFFRPGSAFKQLAAELLPTISRNMKAKQNYRRFAALVKEASARPKVLVLGGSVIGEGFDTILSDSVISLVETDVSLSERTVLVCDAHDLPFVDGAVEGVVAQAVLEHVLDPHRCVAEIHRVLTRNGLVYAEIPFMQQVHGGKFDFTRFTHLGLRRLFRAFDEIDTGPVCGPGMALAWSYTFFLRSFASSKLVRQFVTALAHLTAFWLKYLDHYLIDKPATFDAASGFYFLGRKSAQIVTDKDVLRLYRGG